MKPIWDLSYKWESDTNPFRAYEGNDKQKCTDSNASPYVIDMSTRLLNTLAVTATALYPITS